jgi:hypothetical protein
LAVPNTGSGGPGGSGGIIPSIGAGTGAAGVVVISYPTSYKKARVTNGTYSRVGSNHVYRFTTSGSIIF